MTAAERGIWKSTEMRRRLADAGLDISAGKMSALWTGTPTSIRLDDLDVICSVLACTPTDLLICEPDAVAARKPAAQTTAIGSTATGVSAPPVGAEPDPAAGVTHRFKVLCTVCHATPVAMPRVPYSFSCWPGGPITPPPCLRCGSRTNYYASGLCARCHPSAIPPVESCRDCLAWGATRMHKWLCRGCVAWRTAHPTVAACRTCYRQLNVAADGACRLCHRQATMLRADGELLDLNGANADGQQLFFADMFITKSVTRRPEAEPTADGQIVAPPLHQRRPHQLVLFPARPDLAAHGRPGLVDRCDPETAAQVEALVADHAHRHGWTRRAIKDTATGIRILYGLQDEPGAPIRASDVELLRGIQISVSRVLEVLAATGRLDDDRIQHIDIWFHSQTDDLPEQIRDELGTWYRTMRDGSTTPPRRKPRAHGSIATQMRAALPAIRTWVTQGATSLREVTRNDVLAVLPTDRNARATQGQGLKSIFRILKQRKMIFIDPAARIATGYPQPQTPLPKDPALLQQAMSSADPSRAMIVALIAYHGLRMGELRRLQLTDIRDGRLALGSRSIPLAAAVRTRLRTYLDHRTATWPVTANPHLLVNSRSAWRSTPVGHRWVKLKIGTELTIQAIREDRILDEAHASRGDTRRLTDLFGLSINAANRYTDTVDHPAFADLPTPFATRPH